MRLPDQVDKSDERHCALLLLAVPHHGNVRLANRQRPSWFDNMAARDQQRSIPRSQQVEFELNSENDRNGGHQRVGCVASGVVREGTDGTSAKTPEMLASLFC